MSIFLSLTSVQGAFLTQMQERDSVLIADQLMYGVELKGVDEGTRLFFPEIQEDTTGRMVVVSDWKIDTLKVKKQKKGQPELLDIRAGFLFTAFEEGEYELPPIIVGRLSPDGVLDTLTFEALPPVKVTTIAVDTASFELHDIKGQIRYPVTFREVLPYILIVMLVSALIALTVYLIVKYRKKKIYEETHRDPAHIVALRKLDGYRGDKLWLADKQKVFYSGVTDTLREYIDARYGISAMEMTTKEIFDDLKDTDMPAELYAELKTLFERADFVKFAKYVADNDENAAVLPLAVRFVTTTYQTEVEEESKQS